MLHPSLPSGVHPLVGSVVDLNRPGHYVHWGFIQLSVANLVVIALMLLVFILALVVPFKAPRPGRLTKGPGPEPGRPPETLAGDEHQWTAHLRESTLSKLPPEQAMPDRQPAYVASWIYVFGVLTLSALAVVIVTGCVLALYGPTWWHLSSVGHFFNSLHLWSVEAFFFFMVIHLWGKFFMAAWRGRRRLTWVTGVVAFLVSIATAFTGYLSQQNFDSQWISTQAKDGINSTGAGAFFNVTNFGQMLMWHIVLLPLVVGIIIGIHVLLVRRRGVVPPFERARLGVIEQWPKAAPGAPPGEAPEEAGGEPSGTEDVGHDEHEEVRS